MTIAFLQGLGPMEIFIIPFIILWIWSLVSVIIRKDFSPLTKGVWIAALILLPFACIAYLIYRLSTGKPIPNIKTFEQN